MNRLHNLQEQFAAAILGDDGQHDNESSQVSLFSVEDQIIAGGLTARQRLNIYRNNVNISLRESLQAVYPVVNRLVGDDFFKLMAHEYRKKHPSLSGNLHEFGKHFSSFTAEFAPASQLAYLPDVAKLEWAYHQVFHAAEHPAFDLEKLQTVPPEKYGELFFKLNPASQLLKSDFPVVRIWKANRVQDHDGSASHEDSETIYLDEGGNRILVLRKDQDTEIQLLSACEFDFLQAIQQKQSFFSVCDTVTHTEPDCDVGPLIQKFILCKAIIGFDLSSHTPVFRTM